MKTVYTNTTLDGMWNNFMLTCQNNPIETFLAATIIWMAICYWLTKKEY